MKKSSFLEQVRAERDALATMQGSNKQNYYHALYEAATNADVPSAVVRKLEVLRKELEIPTDTMANDAEALANLRDEERNAVGIEDAARKFEAAAHAVTKYKADARKLIVALDEPIRRPSVIHMTPNPKVHPVDAAFSAEARRRNDERRELHARYAVEMPPLIAARRAREDEYGAKHHAACRSIYLRKKHATLIENVNASCPTPPFGDEYAPTLPRLSVPYPSPAEEDIGGRPCGGGWMPGNVSDGDVTVSFAGAGH
jgi:hypothetical protein